MEFVAISGSENRLMAFNFFIAVNLETVVSEEAGPCNQVM
jgi:hypothetical protein